MALFAIMTDDSDAASVMKFRKALENEFEGKFFHVGGTAWILSTEESTQKVSDMLGLDEGGLTGLVARISNYTGFADLDLWEWLDNQKRE